MKWSRGHKTSHNSLHVLIHVVVSSSKHSNNKYTGAFSTSAWVALLKFHWPKVVSRLELMWGTLPKAWVEGRGIRCGHDGSLPPVVMEIDQRWPRLMPGELHHVQGRIQIPLPRKITSRLMKSIHTRGLWHMTVSI